MVDPTSDSEKFRPQGGWQSKEFCPDSDLRHSSEGETVPNSEVDRIYSRIEEKFKDKFESNLDSTTKQSRNSSGNGIESLKPGVADFQSGQHQKNSANLFRINDNQESEVDSKKFESTEKLLAGFSNQRRENLGVQTLGQKSNDSDQDDLEEDQEDQDDEEIDLDRLRQITKDKFGLNFGLKDMQLNESSDESDDQHNAQEMLTNFREGISQVQKQIFLPEGDLSKQLASQGKY